MTGAGSRRKGHAFERALASKFREVLANPDIRRGFQSRSGAEAPDVDVPGLWVEAKVGRKPNLRAALAQAIAAAPADRIPVAICRDDRKDAVALLRLNDFLLLLTPSQGERREG